MGSIRYRPEIDGLRAVAVIPVILFHFDKDLLPGGYAGVDVFFVISGFLITSIILDEHRRGVFRFLNFWLRRIRRILPALMAMVTVTLVAGVLMMYAADINNLGLQGLASLLSFSNISHLLVAGSYWGNVVGNSPFLHTWSLSVEEQFYFLFPILLFVTIKYFPKWMVLIFFTIGLSSMALFFFGVQTHPSGTFYLLPTRVWEFGVGALLAMISSEGDALRNNPAFSAVGALILLMSYFLIGGKDGVSSLLVLPVFGSALVIAFARDGKNIISRLLSFYPVAYIGKISYSLYLWHWPVLFFFRQLELNKNLVINPAIVFLVTFAVSVLSYHFVEGPTRGNKRVDPYLFAVLLAGVCFSLYLEAGDYREDTSFFNKTEWYSNQYDVNPHQEWPEWVRKKMMGITVLDSNRIDLNAYASGGIQKMYGVERPDIVVLGDSHALMWAKVLDEIAKETLKSIAFYAAGGTPSFFDIPAAQKMKGTQFFSAHEKYLFDKARLKFLTEWKPGVVVIVARWSREDKKDTNDLIRYIGGIGSKILLIEQPPELFFGDKNAPQYLSYLGMHPTNGSKQYIRRSNNKGYQNGIALVEKIADENDFCVKVPVADIYLNADQAWVIDSRDVLYIDDDHLSYAGALKAKERISAALKKLIERN